MIDRNMQDGNNGDYGSDGFNDDGDTDHEAVDDNDNGDN